MSGIQESGESSSQFEKLCLTAIESDPFTRGCRRFLIYIVDANSSSSSSSSGVPPTLKPIIELDYSEFPSAAIAVMGTKLYVIGGNDTDPSKCINILDNGLELHSAYWKSEVYVYDIKQYISSSSSSSETTKLQKSCVHDRLDMTGRKLRPSAVRIDDYRICAFSTDLLYNRKQSMYFPEPRFTPPCFEVLDTRGNTWTPLPELLDKYPGWKKDPRFTLSVTTYAVKRSTLIVHTTTGDIFLMNFDAPHLQWEHLSTLKIPKSYTFPVTYYPLPAVIIGVSVLCTPFEIMELGKTSRNYHPILTKDVAQESLCKLSGALCIEGHHVYIARFGETERSREYYLWLDLYNFPHLSYGRGRKPDNLKSSCFSLDGVFILLEGCFPIKGC